MISLSPAVTEEEITLKQISFSSLLGIIFALRKQKTVYPWPSLPPSFGPEGERS
ncbi:hypothetical protein CEXT_349141, partial [Caerostris extrusa]